MVSILEGVRNRIYSENLQNLYEKVKYKTSPVIYRVLYDKYNRPEIYNEIIQHKIEEIQSLEGELKNEISNNFTEKSKFSGFSPSEYTNSSSSFPEIIVMSYYNQVFKERTFLLFLSLLTLGQYTLSRLFIKPNWEEKAFIFLDNNRAIFNKIVKANMGISSFLQISFYVTFSVSLYLTMKMVFRSITDELEEEGVVKQKYKRSLILYQKLH